MREFVEFVEFDFVNFEWQVTSRLENGLGNTTFSIHEQPVCNPYLSQPSHLATVAHDVMGARWRGGRPGSPKDIYPGVENNPQTHDL